MSFTFPTTLFANASVLSTQALSIATSTSLSARVLPPGDLYPPQPPGTGPGKRGLIYNNETEVGWDTYFSMVKDVTYGSNGDVIRGDQLQVGYNYVPTVKVDTDLNNDEWNFTTPVLIEGGVKALFASNEPNNASEANLTPRQAAIVYHKYMQPYHGTVQLGTPSVVDAAGHSGLDFLEEFMGNCKDCDFNFVNVHYYRLRADVTPEQYAIALRNYIDNEVPAVQAKYEQLNGLPIFVGQWWLWGASEEEGGELMDLLLPYLDNNDNVLAYQAFGGLFKGAFINANGSGLTPAGQKYATESRSI